MTWELEDVTVCTRHAVDVAYINNGDGCPHCTTQAPKTGHTDVMSIPLGTNTSKRKTSGLATVFDVPSAGKIKTTSLGANIPAKELGYIPTFRQFEETFKRSSQLEYRRYQLLFAHEQNGIIHSLVLQPKTIIKPRVHVAANGIHNGYKQRAANYSGDFAYWYKDMLIIEDAKDGKIDSSKKPSKQIVPYIRTAAARNAHKDLTIRYKKLGLHAHISFLLTVEINRRWYYLNSEKELIDFSWE